MPTKKQQPEKIRDAERSRNAILDAAEQLFARDGFNGTSLYEIAAAAGLSRGAPNYFFGAKTDLYTAMMERVFEDREMATTRAFDPLVKWSSGVSGETLESVLSQAVAGYMKFLTDRPTFVTLLQREELDGGKRLARTPRAAKAVREAFVELREQADSRGVGAFDVAQAVVLFVSLTFSPLAQRNTFMASLSIDLDEPAERARHVEFVVSQLASFVSSGES